MRCVVQLVVRAALAATTLIGPGALPSQSRPANPLSILRIEDRYQRFRTCFNDLLDEAQPADWQAGWQLAEDIGGSVSALLSEMWEEEGSKLQRRLLFQVARSLAGGPPSLSQTRLDDREKVMALLFLATGPRRAGATGDLARFTHSRERTVVRVAAYLALSRQQGDVPPIRAQDTQDPGLLAAALHAGLSLAERELEPWLALDPERTDRDRIRQLVWRGFLLAERQPDPDRSRRLELAVEVFGVHASSSHPGIREARRAAALCLARLGELDLVRKSFPDPDPELVVLLATEPRMRTVSRFAAEPNRLLDPPLRRRLAVLYALTEAPETVLAAADEWTGDAVIRGAMCLAAALSLLDGARVTVPESVRALPEGAWVQWAAREEVATSAQGSGDPFLARALRLALDDRLPSDAARRILEEALWRSGSHPGLARVEAHVALLRDLLLSDSVPVSATLLPDAEDRYLPAGIDRTDAFFEIAWQFLQFRAERFEIPPSLRLR